MKLQHYISLDTDRAASRCVPQDTSAKSLLLLRPFVFFSATGHDWDPQLDFLSVITPFQYQTAIHIFYFLSYQRLKFVSLWDFRGQRKASSFAPRVQPPTSCSCLSSIKSEDSLPSSPGWTPRSGSICSQNHVIPSIIFPVRLLNAPQPGDLLLQSGQLLKSIIQLGTSSPMTPVT